MPPKKPPPSKSKKKSRASTSSVERAISVRMAEDAKLVEDLQRQTRFEDFHEHMDLPTFQVNAVLAMLDLLYPEMEDEEKVRLMPHADGLPLDDARASKAYLALRRHQASLIEDLSVGATAESILKGEGLQKILLREQIREAMGAEDARSRSVALAELMARVAPVARESPGMTLVTINREDLEFWQLADREIAEEDRIMKRIGDGVKKTAARRSGRDASGGRWGGGS